MQLLRLLILLSSSPAQPACSPATQLLLSQPVERIQSQLLRQLPLPMQQVGHGSSEIAAERFREEVVEAASSAESKSSVAQTRGEPGALSEASIEGGAASRDGSFAIFPLFTAAVELKKEKVRGARRRKKEPLRARASAAVGSLLAVLVFADSAFAASECV